MDDDLMFAISGLAKSAPLRTMEESCRELCRGVDENAQWKRTLLLDRRQKKLVLDGVIYMLEQDRISRRGLNASLALLRVYRSSDEEVFGLDELELAKRLAMALTKELFIPSTALASSSSSSSRSISMKHGQEYKDELFGNPLLGSFDVAADLLAYFTSSRFVASSSVIRNEIARLKMHHFVFNYVRYQFEQRPTGTEERLRFEQLALTLVGNLSYDCKENSLVFATELSRFLVAATASPCEGTRETALKSLMNVSNNCPEAAQLLVVHGAIATVLEVLKSNLERRSEVSDLSPSEFDGVLNCLSVLGNLVEHPEAGGSAAILDSGQSLAFLCQVYSLTIPIRARQSLADGNSSEIVEFNWTPEQLLISSYVCLVLGCLVRDSREASEYVLRMIPGGKTRGFSPLIQVLQGFLDFQREAEILSPEMEATVRQIAKYFSEANNRSMLPPSSLIPPPPKPSPAKTATSMSAEMILRENKKRKGMQMKSLPPNGSSSSSSSSSPSRTTKQ